MLASPRSRLLSFQVPLEIYELMLAAWHAEGGQRPAFADMRQKTLDPLVSAGPGIVLTMS